MASFKSLLISAANAAVVAALVVRHPPPPPVKGSTQLVYRNVSTSILAAIGTPHYQDVTCGYQDVGNAYADGPTRWAEADADNAFAAFNNVWNNGIPGNPGNPLSYVRALSSWWNGPENWDCGILENACSAGVQSCGDKNTVGPNGHSIQNPAAWMIMNSFSNIHNFYFNQYLSFIVAKSDISSNLHSFATTFSPVPPSETDLIKLILDGLSLAYGQLAAFSWNKILKDLPVFEGAEGGKNHGWSKDITNSIVSGMITLGKDLLPPAKSQIEAEQDLQSMLGKIVDNFESTTVQYLKFLFSGSATGIPSLATVIGDGKWIDPVTTKNTFLSLDDMKGFVEQVLYAQLMPVAWHDVGGLHPVIVMDNSICTSSPAASGTSAGRYIPQDIQSAVGICYNNIGFYLLSVNDDTRPGPAHDPIRPPGAPDYRRSATSPETNSFEPRREIPPFEDPQIFDLLPGADKANLNGQNWAGIVIEDLVISSYSAWVLNGNKNGYSLPDDTMVKDETGAQGDTLFPSGLRTPGVFTLPLCTIDQAVDNWRNHWSDGSKPQYYPCNS